MTERQPGSDPISELQRWLVRSGARSVTRQLGDQVRTALGGGNNTRADVWESATADHEAPECQWCPICRARRRLRESGPGLSSSLAAAGDAVSVVLQDAATAFETAVAAAARQARPRDEAPASGTVWDEATEPAARPLPRIVPDPPATPAGSAGFAGTAEAGGAAEAFGTAEAAWSAGAAEAAGPAGTAEPAGSAGATGTAGTTGTTGAAEAAGAAGVTEREEPAGPADSPATSDPGSSGPTGPAE